MSRPSFGTRCHWSCSRVFFFVRPRSCLLPASSRGVYFASKLYTTIHKAVCTLKQNQLEGETSQNASLHGPSPLTRKPPCRHICMLTPAFAPSFSSTTIRCATRRSGKPGRRRRRVLSHPSSTPGTRSTPCSWVTGTPPVGW